MSSMPYKSDESDVQPFQSASVEGEYDMEKSPMKDVNLGVEAQETPVPEDKIKRTGPLWRFSEKLGKFGVEERGIERVFPNERTQTSAWACFWMWLAANSTVSTFALGTLGSSIWFLGFRDASLTIIFFNLLAAIPVGIFSVWGPRTGCRQLALSRFGFGYWTVMIPVVLNCVACIGWSTVNSIAGGLVLVAVSYDSSLKPIPVAAAIVVIAISTLIVSFMGYRIVHIYEKYSWIPTAIIFLIYAIQVGRFAEQGPYGGTGQAEAASVLSFGAAILGFAIGWVSLAADYSCKLPENISGVKVFTLTYLGVVIPCIFLEILGAAAMTTFNNKPTWEDAYTTYDIGGLLAAPLIGPMGGFGRFLMVLLALSIISNNIPNMYSFALTFQVLGPWAQAIPRPILVVVGTGIYIALSIAGASHFASALDNILVLLAYWLSIYAIIMVQEHYIFRKGSFRNWNLEDLDNPRRLPLGVASFLALGIGWVGAVLGMSTTFYVGHVALKLNPTPPFGTDFGFEMALAFSGLTYPPLRYIEKRYWKF